MIIPILPSGNLLRTAIVYHERHHNGGKLDRIKSMLTRRRLPMRAVAGGVSSAPTNVVLPARAPVIAMEY